MSSVVSGFGFGGALKDTEVILSPVDVIRAIPFGRFHYILIIIHLILYVSSSVVIYNMAFLQMYPAYECSHLEAGNKLVIEKCSRD